MKYRKLGNTDLRVSSIGLGCVTFGREIDQDTSFTVMDRALEECLALWNKRWPACPGWAGEKEGEMNEVDARGLPCPRPVLETKRALQDVDDGTITVLVDSPESRENVQRFARSQGCQVEVSEADGMFRLTIVKERAKEVPKAATVQQRELPEGGTVVLITTDRFGVGDDRLGQILMKSFLNTLWDHDPRPAKLLFINSGVRLTTEGSDVLDALELLEKDGVEVFSCGTCIEYYGIQDKLKVGSVTNMYDTVNTLLTASHVVSV